MVPLHPVAGARADPAAVKAARGYWMVASTLSVVSCEACWVP
jgi:hypothetical protein